MELFLATLFILICVLLIIVVLLQKGRGGGLGSIFSGAGSSAFGTRTGDVFTWVTIVLTGLFLLLAIGTSLYYRPSTPAPPTQQPVEAPAPEPAGQAAETMPAQVVWPEEVVQTAPSQAQEDTSPEATGEPPPGE